MFPPTRTLIGFSATYADSGIRSLNLILDNQSLITLGSVESVSDNPQLEITTWLFGDREDQIGKFVGLTAWQTSSVIRSIGVVTLD